MINEGDRNPIDVVETSYDTFAEFKICAWDTSHGAAHPTVRDWDRFDGSLRNICLVVKYHNRYIGEHYGGVECEEWIS